MNKDSDIMRMHEFLFPNKELHNDIMIFNKEVVPKLFKVILSWSIISATLVFMSFLLPDTLDYIAAVTATYITLSMMALHIIMLYKPRSKIYKQQISELNAHQTRYHKELILHDNYKKYNIKWNVIYSVIMTLSFYISMSLFINDLISTGHTTLGPIVALIVTLLVLLIPALILNMLDFNRFRKKQQKIEYQIEHNTI